MNEKIEAVMELDKIVKHSVRFACREKDSPLPTIYIRKPYFEKAKLIKITIEVEGNDTP